MAKILIVEDNEMNRDMLSRRLARRGYEIINGGRWRRGDRRGKDPDSRSHPDGYEPAGRGRLGSDTPAESR